MEVGEDPNVSQVTSRLEPARPRDCQLVHHLGGCLGENEGYLVLTEADTDSEPCRDRSWPAAPL